MRQLTFTFKEDWGCQVSDIQKMNAYLIVVLGYFTVFCQSQGVPCEITNVRTKFPQSQSDTHPDGRAFDASLRDWDTEAIKKCIVFMEEKAGHLGAVSASDYKRRIVVHHDVGLGDHLHFQVRRF